MKEANFFSAVERRLQGAGPDEREISPVSFKKIRPPQKDSKYAAADQKTLAEQSPEEMNEVIKNMDELSQVLDNLLALRLGRVPGVGGLLYVGSEGRQDLLDQYDESNALSREIKEIKNLHSENEKLDNAHAEILSALVKNLARFGALNRREENVNQKALEIKTKIQEEIDSLPEDEAQKICKILQNK